MYELSTSSAVFDGAEDTFKRLAKIGYTGVDVSFSLLYNKGIFDLPESEFEKYIKNLHNEIKQSGLKVVQCHAPYQIPWVNDKKVINATIKSIRAAGELNSPYIVVHPLMPFSMINENAEQAKESKRINMEFFRMLIPWAKEYNVKICIENLFPKDSPAASGECLLDYIKTLDSDWIAACLDTGHANLCSYNIADMIHLLGDKLAVLHLHDNWGQKRNYDLHHCPFLGSIDWQKVMHALKETDYKGAFNMENTDFSMHFPPELQCVAEELSFNSLKYIVDRYFN